MLSGYFTRLAMVGAAALVAFKLVMPDYGDPDLVHFIPDDPTERNVLRFNPPFSAYTMQFGSVYDALDCANDNHASGISASAPEGMLKSTFDEAQGNPREQLCIWGAFDPFKDLTNSERFSTDIDQYLSNSQFETQTHFQENFEPSDEYKAWEDERMETALKNIANDPFILQNFKKWKSQAEYESLEDAGEQYLLKKKILQKISDHIRSSFDLESIPVSVYVFPPDSGTLAHYDPNNDSIAVNYNAMYAVTRSLNRTLATIIEEAKHSVDAALLGLYMRGEFDNDDLRAEHAAAIWLNNKEYITSIKAWRFEQNFNLIEVITTLGFPEYEAYAEQYIERNAKEMAQEFDDKIMRDLHCNNDDTLQCIKYKALSPF